MLKVNAAPIAPKDTLTKVPVQSLPKQQEETGVRAIVASPKARSERETTRADEILRRMYGQPNVEVTSSIPVALPAAVTAAISTNPTVENTVGLTTVHQNPSTATHVDESLLDAMVKTIAKVKSVVVADTTDRNAASMKVSEVLQLLRGYGEAKTRLPFIFEGDSLHTEFMGKIQKEISAYFDSKSGASSVSAQKVDDDGRILPKRQETDDRNSSYRAAGRQLPRSGGQRSKDMR